MGAKVNEVLDDRALIKRCVSFLSLSILFFDDVLFYNFFVSFLCMSMD